MIPRASRWGLLLLAVVVSSVAGCGSRGAGSGLAVTPGADSSAETRRTSANEVVQYTDEERARFTHVALMIQGRFGGVQVYPAAGGYVIQIRGKSSLKQVEQTGRDGTRLVGSGLGQAPQSSSGSPSQSGVSPGTEPLIVVDGIVRGGLSELATVSPKEVFSIGIIKDGAGALYGSRAANGVIVITTLRARSPQ